MIENDDLLGLIQRAANLNNRYNVPYLGQVSSIDDPDGLDRFIVQIPALGWTTNDSAAKCSVIHIKGYITPRLDDYVIVQFLEGDRNRPIIIGVANHMKNMLPYSYEKDIDVLYEQKDKIKMTYDGDQMLIGNTGFSPVARKEDEIKSTSTEDSSFWTWLMTTLVTWANSHTHVSALPGNPTASGVPPLGSAPTSLTGKITDGSDQTQIGNK